MRGFTALGIWAARHAGRTVLNFVLNTKVRQVRQLMKRQQDLGA